MAYSYTQNTQMAYSYTQNTQIPLLLYIWTTVPHLLATFTQKMFTLKIFLRFLDSKVCSQKFVLDLTYSNIDISSNSF